MPTQETYIGRVFDFTFNIKYDLFGPKSQEVRLAIALKLEPWISLIAAILIDKNDSKKILLMNYINCLTI